MLPFSSAATTGETSGREIGTAPADDMVSYNVYHHNRHCAHKLAEAKPFRQLYYDNVKKLLASAKFRFELTEIQEITHRDCARNVAVVPRQLPGSTRPQSLAMADNGLIAMRRRKNGMRQISL